jgi:hypothetical protein
MPSCTKNIRIRSSNHNQTKPLKQRDQTGVKWERGRGWTKLACNVR